ncbi:3-deoxy-8-phosphooctulonate synthase [Sphingomonas nostoxanthinifaciens]|uniref:3-deoxy-8-phosphooctulonate synthase n=1 Tax=Sphingomonas nostoxanthinifaciens TaxID=2872652 RepID=UPI001CC1C440|nr:3-deoxy-8-phosphooctulonate synthase [Sphingomonas nostoxanthinifaciens]UAK24977.1 3-deoxy-8-phosphooctulonate synthase [Sphingomonas nostoxanthinifaciens]
MTLTFEGHSIGLDHPIFLIAGPCVIESETMALSTAERLRTIGERLGMLIVYKSSFDKANRSAGNSFRGPGLTEGLRILAKVRETLDMPVLTDVHEPHQVAPVAEVVDMLQTPAFLARQTDLIEAVATCGKPVNVKKGQFMAPGDMKNVVAKGREVAAAAGLGEPPLMVCDRGASFGYGNLVSDMRGLVIMRETGCPVLFDATHSVQLPGGQGTTSGGQREFIPVLARAAVAVGISGLFMETHPDPANAKSDGPNAVPLDRFEDLARELIELDQFVKTRPRVSL